MFSFSIFSESLKFQSLTFQGCTNLLPKFKAKWAALSDEPMPSPGLDRTYWPPPWTVHHEACVMNGSWRSLLGRSVSVFGFWGSSFSVVVFVVIVVFFPGKTHMKGKMVSYFHIFTFKTHTHIIYTHSYTYICTYVDTYFYFIIWYYVYDGMHVMVIVWPRFCSGRVEPWWIEAEVCSSI